MITRTSLIVLNYIRYTDNSIIVNAISEEYGRIAFIVRGIGSKRRSKLSLFQPLFILDTQLYVKQGRDLQQIKEMRLSPPLAGLTSDITKSSLAMFIAELISKTVKEQHPDTMLFHFIKTQILFLDNEECNTTLFHIVFLLKFSRYLGFTMLPEDDTDFFDYKEGKSLSIKPRHKFFIDKKEIEILKILDSSDFSEFKNIDIGKSVRNSILISLMNMYEIHVLNFTSLNSYEVLKTVYS